MLTGFTFCIPIKSKKPEDDMKAYTDNINCVFGPSKKILTDNGMEFKNKLWTDVFKRLQTEHRTPIYSPQCNGRIEGFHKFLKATLGKQLQKGLEWDDVIPKQPQLTISSQHNHQRKHHSSLCLVIKQQ